LAQAYISTFWSIATIHLFFHHQVHHIGLVLNNEEVVKRRSEIYTNSFTKLSGLPYSYRIKARMDKALNTSRTLKIKDIHPY